MGSRTPAWSGLFTLDIGRSLYVGPGRHAAMHAHHAMQACVGLEGPLRLRTSPGAAWTEHDGCVIAPEQAHEFDAGGKAVALLFIEPEGPDGRRVAAVAGWRGGAPSRPTRGLPRVADGPGVTPLDEEVVRRVRSAFAGGPGAEDAKGTEAFLAALGVDAGTAPLDARVRKAIAILRKCHHDYPTSAELAAAVGLSPGRFRHLWLAEVGLAYRRYLLWLRLQAVLGSATRRPSLTEAAHEAGFADSAHLARTFRRLLGITPSAMPVASGDAATGDRKGSRSWAR